MSAVKGCLPRGMAIVSSYCYLHQIKASNDYSMDDEERAHM